MLTNYFTFGCGHPLRKYYVVIKGEDETQCREVMVKQFGSCWCMQYDTPEAAGVERYGLKPIEAFNPFYD